MLLMAAPVRIDGDFWTSWKAESLAAGLGVEVECAVGRIAKLWSFASDKGLYAVPKACVRTYLKSPDAVEVLIAADLGELLDDGTVRLQGSRRFESLWSYKKSRSAGGSARAAGDGSRDELTGQFRNAGNRAPASTPAHDQHDSSTSPGVHQRSSSGSSSGSDSPDPALDTKKKTCSTVGESTARSQARAPRGVRLPEDWVPGRDHIDLARELGLNLDAEAAEMRDWAKSNPKAFKADWDATFRNWLRKSAKDRRPRGGGSQSRDLLDWQMQRIREAEERERNGE